MKYLKLEFTGAAPNRTARVILNRPEVHNAFNPAMIREITETFESFCRDNSLRAIVLSGSGKSFCAGGDLQWMQSMVDYSFEENVKDAELLFEMYETLLNCEVPLIAKLHGNAMGGGLGLAAVCDIVAAEKETRFCFSEAKLGLVPSVISSFVLRKIPEHFARELMITAEVFDSAYAERMGLVHFTGENEEVDDYLQSKIDFIYNNGPEAIRSIKGLLKKIHGLSWSEIRKETTELIASRRVSDEGQEGLRAFLEKRAPKWKAKANP